jgi:hypothetical protein
MEVGKRKKTSMVLIRFLTEQRSQAVTVLPKRVSRSGCSDKFTHIVRLSPSQLALTSGDCEMILVLDEDARCIDAWGMGIEKKMKDANSGGSMGDVRRAAFQDGRLLKIEQNRRQECLQPSQTGEQPDPLVLAMQADCALHAPGGQALRLADDRWIVLDVQRRILHQWPKNRFRPHEGDSLPVCSLPGVGEYQRRPRILPWSDPEHVAVVDYDQDKVHICSLLRGSIEEQLVAPPEKSQFLVQVNYDPSSQYLITAFNPWPLPCGLTTHFSTQVLATPSGPLRHRHREFKVQPGMVGQVQDMLLNNEKGLLHVLGHGVDGYGLYTFSFE